MGWLFTDHCAGCGISDDKVDLISIRGTIYRLGTANGANAKVCPDCYIKIRDGKSNFSLKNR